MIIRIALIETFLYRAEGRGGSRTAFGCIPRRSAVLLRVDDADGAHGWGEFWRNFPPYSADNKMQPFVAAMRRWAIQSGEYGPVAACLAVLDLALWDLISRPPRRIVEAGAMPSARAPASSCPVSLFLW